MGQNSFSAWIRLHGGVGDAQHVQLDVFDTKGVASPAACPSTSGLPSCGANGGVLSVLDDWMWTVKGRVGNDGESPCHQDQGLCPTYSPSHCDGSCCDQHTNPSPIAAYGYVNDGQGCDQCVLSAYVDGQSFCNKNNLGDANVSYSRRVYVRVRLKSQATPTSCDPYVFTVSNNQLDANQGF
jgi:hypothetical protein